MVVVLGAVVFGDEFLVVVVDEGTVVDTLGTVVGTGTGMVVVEAVSTVLVVESGTRLGAATLSAVSGRSLTRSSAALTICHVRVVVRMRTSSHAPKSPKRITR